MFSKKDLDNGNVVELRSGRKFLYHNIDRSKILDVKGFTYLNLNDYDENLKCKVAYLNSFDIMKVYKDYTCKELLWERKENKKPLLTEDEKVILRNLPKEYKWIARDSDGRLYIYASKPKKGITIWKDIGLPVISYDHLFQFIKWEDEEPYLIEELLKGE